MIREMFLYIENDVNSSNISNDIFKEGACRLHIFYKKWHFVYDKGNGQYMNNRKYMKDWLYTRLWADITYKYPNYNIDEIMDNMTSQEDMEGDFMMNDYNFYMPNNFRNLWMIYNDKIRYYAS